MEYDPRYLKAIDEFNQRLFYEAHETLEDLWLEDHGPEREFYQGIIQVAAGYFKWEQEVPQGAVKLFRSAIRKLEPYRPVCLGVQVTEFLSDVEADLAVIEAWRDKGGAAPELRMPRLSRPGEPSPDSRTSR
jgi:predicted metal-dependent hydrolase